MTKIKVPNRKILTVCIPTYNRAFYICTQVNFLCNFIKENHLEEDVEVIVANNFSTDTTLSDLQSLNHTNFKIYNHPQHYLTAEENIFRSLSACEGKYVWFLGDDDPVHYVNLLYVIEQIKQDKMSCFIFNSMTSANNGLLALRSPIHTNAEYIDFELTDLVESIGLLYTFAGISNIIIKRELLDVQAGLEWLHTSPIYSHVAWLLEALKGERVRFCNSSLVVYRQAAYPEDHWTRLAERLSVQSRYFWSFGIIVLLQKLCDRNVLNHTNIANMYEVAADGRRYRLLDEIAYNFYYQMEFYAKVFDKRESFGGAELHQASMFILACDSAYYNMMQMLTAGWTKLHQAVSFEQAQLYLAVIGTEFRGYFEKWTHDGAYKSKLIGVYYGFEVYKFSQQYVGVIAGFSNKVSVLSCCDAVADNVNIVTGVTRTAVVDSARLAAEARLRLTGEADLKATSTHRTTLNLESRLHDMPLPDTEGLGAQLLAIRSSTSWKITAPLRSIVLAFRRLMVRSGEGA